jgi:hypothetical protein
MSDTGKLPEVYAGAAKETAPAAEPVSPAEPAAPGERPAAERPPVTAAAEQGPLPGPDAPPPPPGIAGRIAESREINMYPPPPIPQRPFRFDYRQPAIANEVGKLFTDMERRPLEAKYVAGRRFAYQGDVALTPAEMRAALTDLDIRLAEVARLPMADDANVSGIFSGEMVGHRPAGDIFVKSRLSEGDRFLTTLHELGHAIDHYTNYFSDHLTPDEIEELRKVYTRVRAGASRTRILQPEDFGYVADDVNGELVAEGFRAYMLNPNWFKLNAPRSAAKFRAEVNKNRWLKRVIQFNSLAAAAGLAGAGIAASQDRHGKDHHGT